MGVREEVPGSWEGPLGVGEPGRVSITGWRVLITGWRGWERRKVGKGAPGLAYVSSARTGGNLVVCRTTVRAKPGVRPATTFLRGEGAVASAGTIHIHGDGTRGGRGRGGTVRDNRGGAGEGVGRVMGAGEGSSRLVLLHRNGCCHVGLKGSG